MYEGKKVLVCEYLKEEFLMNKKEQYNNYLALKRFAYYCSAQQPFFQENVGNMTWCARSEAKPMVGGFA